MSQLTLLPFLWQSITFGQSTDMEYSIGVLPDKIGFNLVIPDGQDSPLSPETPAAVSDVTIESRGGKIQPDHDGLTFYYTKLPSSAEFSLSAHITLLQFGPETRTAPNGQEACGLMIRDSIGPARRVPFQYGYEEYPSASNMAMLNFSASSRTLDPDLDLCASFRTGIYDPTGNSNARFHVQIVESKFLQAKSSDGSNRYQGNFFFTLKRKGNTFTFLYSKNGEKPRSVSLPDNLFSPSDLTVLDPKWIYVGFFAARNAQMKIKNISLTVSENKSSSAAHSFSAAETAVTAARTDLYVSPEGSPSGTGTKDDPLSMDKAVSLLSPGGTIHMMPGIYQPVQIPMDASGTFDRLKHICAEGSVSIQPGSNPSPLFILDSDYWSISGLDLNGNKQRGVSGFMICGNHNQICSCQVHHTHTTARDAGFMITTIRKEKKQWPSYNRLLRCLSYENHDDTNQNADGFACRTGAGEGNCFIFCVAHHNSDDGFDLFNNINDGPNGKVLLEHCIAFSNNSNGFKLGGEGREVAHIIRHCLAFENGLHGFTDNFNPGALLLEYNTAYDNKKSNYYFRPSPYKKNKAGQPCSDCILHENYSFHTNASPFCPDVLSSEHIKNHMCFSSAQKGADT